MKGSTKVANKLFRNFFLWIRSKEFLVFLFFFVVSGFFWGTQAIQEPAEMELDVTVKLVDKPKPVVITEIWPETLKVTVRDKGYNLIGYYFDKVNPIEIRYETYAREDGKIVVSNSDLNKLLKKKLKRTTEVLVIKPDRLEASYNHGGKKKVKVVFNGVLKEADRYFISKVALTPDSVMVYATQDELAKINSVMTQYLSISDISKNETRKVFLKKLKGVKFVPNVVTLEVNADVMRDASTEVPIKAQNVPDSITLNVWPQNVSVSYVTGASNLEAISSEDFEVVVDYKDIEKDNSSDKIQLKLQKSPALVKRPRLASDSVKYSIERH